MPEIDSEKRKAGLAFADRLSEIAVEAPDLLSEKSVHDLAGTIRKRFTYSRELRKREILTQVRKRGSDVGCSVGELAGITGYNKDLVYDLSRELTSEGLIECRKIPPAGRGPGRPTERIFPANLPDSGNFSDQKS